MAVNEETLKKVKDYVAGIDESKIGKCGICSDTLLDITKKCEAKTKAKQYTVVQAIAERFNDQAAKLDKITPRALGERVRRLTKPSRKKLSKKDLFDQLKNLITKSDGKKLVEIKTKLEVLIKEVDAKIGNKD